MTYDILNTSFIVDIRYTITIYHHQVVLNFSLKLFLVCVLEPITDLICCVLLRYIRECYC